MPYVAGLKELPDAIAKVQEAFSLAEEQQIHSALHTEEPCEANHSAEDAAFRHALLASEDAMLSALEALPAVSGKAAAFLN